MDFLANGLNELNPAQCMQTRGDVNPPLLAFILWTYFHAGAVHVQPHEGMVREVDAPKAFRVVRVLIDFLQFPMPACRGAQVDGGFRLFRHGAAGRGGSFCQYSPAEHVQRTVLAGDIYFAGGYEQACGLVVQGKGAVAQVLLFPVLPFGHVVVCTRWGDAVDATEVVVVGRQVDVAIHRIYGPLCRLVARVGHLLVVAGYASDFLEFFRCEVFI